MGRFVTCAVALGGWLASGAGCTLDAWANGTWRLDAATMDAVRGRAASSRESGELVDLAERFRLDLLVPSATARFEDDGDEPIDPFSYSAENAGLRELQLTAATWHAAWPTSFWLRCSSRALGGCSSAEIISSEPFFAVPAPMISLVRER